MTDRVFALPDLGEGLTEAEIVEWLVEDRAQVVVDQNVVVVETAKATVEVPIPFAGTVSTRHGAPGDVVTVGAPLITVADGSSNRSSNGSSNGSAAASGSSGAGQDEDSGAVLIGYGTGHGKQPRRRRASRRAAGEHTAPTTAPAPPAPPAAAASPQVISPIVRRMAREAGLDLNVVRPRVGTVLRRSDIEAALRAGSTTPEAAAPAAPTTITPTAITPTAAAPTDSAGDERIPLTGVRRMIAEKLTTSRREIPDATTWVDVDATELVAAREQLRPDGIGLLALLARFCVAGLTQFPELNASVQGDVIVRHGRVNLGFAAQSPRGLVVPVVKDAHTMTTRQLAAALAELTEQARTGTLAPADLTGGTFTLNNYGVFGVDGSTPILNHPEAAMLGVGRIIDRPWVVAGQLAVRKVTQLGFTFDHRVCDGGSAGGFLRFVADAVEHPVRVLADC